MLEIVNLVGNSRKRIILLENSFLGRIHRIFGKVKVSIFTIERRMQEYWKDERGLRSTYAFYQLFSRVSSAEVLKLLKWKNCSINQGQTFFISNKTYLMCLGRLCIFLTALWDGGVIGNGSIDCDSLEMWKQKKSNKAFNI